MITMIPGINFKKVNKSIVMPTHGTKNRIRFTIDLNSVAVNTKNSITYYSIRAGDTLSTSRSTTFINVQKILKSCPVYAGEFPIISREVFPKEGSSNAAQTTAASKERHLQSKVINNNIYSEYSILN